MPREREAGDPEREKKGASVAEALLKPYLKALLGIPSGEEDEDAVLSENYYVEWPRSSAPTTRKEEATAEHLPSSSSPSVASKSALLIPASLPAALPLPAHPDLAARVAEGVWKGVVECLGRQRGDSQADISGVEDEEGELSFWPPRENGADDEDD